ncbi:MAG: S8 family serine peptidase, partial [Kiritimatiellae bacterium]|nr:S8 family serine peptidase [Kiritimatiellia bacterium]
MKRFYLAVLAISVAGSVVWMCGRYSVKTRPTSGLPQVDQQGDSADGKGSVAVSVSLPKASTAEKLLSPTTGSSAEELLLSSNGSSVSSVAVKRPRGRLADPAYRAKQVRKHSLRFKHEQAEAVARSKKEGWHPVDTGQGQLMAIKNGKPLVYQVENANAAISTAASFVRDNPIYGVDGSNIVVGIWDEGSARVTHQEFGGRVTSMDGAGVSSHSTHVSGTVAASGVTASAKGMVPAVTVESYDWNDDLGEMTSRAMADPNETDKIQISNHSYGYTSGWNWLSSPVSWYGTWGAGVRESDNFGIYSDEPAILDALCYDAPYYLPVKSAGNDRNDAAPSSGTLFQYYDGGFYTKTYDPATDPLADYGNGGFDTISIVGNAKNILTVGSVNDAVSGATRVVANAAMESYSGWGPTDDGRIKPDIVANGANVYSTLTGSDSDYGTMSGTSMAAPNAVGSAALLIEYYKKMFGTPITSALLKGLIIHTADDLGLAGPDYKNGWGLMNTEEAAEYMRLHNEYPLADIMYEDFLDSTNVSNDIFIQSDGVNPIKVTICWTDPAGDGQVTLNNRTPVLINDLDLRIVDTEGVTNYPFMLDVENPSALAVTGDNLVDNVEQVIVQVPTSGVYRVSVSHKGVLDGELQYYALVVSGAAAPPVIEHEPYINTTNSSSPYLIEATITSLDPLKENGTWLFWSTNGFSSAAESNLMVNVSNDLFSASIPAQPLGADISYYIYTETSHSLVVTDPVSAPSTSHGFTVAPGVNLTVYGTPSELGTVSPDYGVWAYPSGVVVHASASAVTPESAGHRYASAGWIGANDVPAEGLSNSVSFLIEHDSAMFWRWDSQYSLVQSSSVVGIFNITNWWKELTMGMSVTAEVAVVHDTVSYNFAEWQVDGARMPDSTNIAVNPVTDLLMATSHVATAIYLPSDEDTDLDGLSDWWERFYFGSLVQIATADPDGDGYLNMEEFEDQSNPRDPLSIPAGPVIVHTALASIQSNPAPWTVSATVTDNSLVASVTLRWRRNGLTWRQAAMAETATPDIYAADIPASGLLDNTFEYTIQATDDSGYFAEDGPHNIFVAYPLVDVVQTNIYDFVMLINSLTNSSFSIGNSGNTNLNFQIAVESVGFEDDMESGTNSWQHSGQNDNWHITTNRYFSGGHSWYCGNSQNSLYDNATDASLVIQKTLLSTNAQLSFMQWMKTELDVEPYTWDGGVLEISLDDGATYQVLTPEGGYPKLIVDNPDSPFAPDTPCLGG